LLVTHPTSPKSSSSSSSSSYHHHHINLTVTRKATKAHYTGHHKAEKQQTVKTEKYKSKKKLKNKNTTNAKNSSKFVDNCLSFPWRR